MCVHFGKILQKIGNQLEILQVHQTCGSLKKVMENSLYSNLIHHFASTLSLEIANKKRFIINL
jgi:hypothetical protein